MLSLEAAHRLKAELLAGRNPAEDAGTVPSRVVVWQAGLADLGAARRDLEPGGRHPRRAGGILLFLGQELPAYFRRLQEGLAGIVGAVSPALAAAVFLGTTLALGWLLSIGLTVVRYHGLPAHAGARRAPAPPIRACSPASRRW